MTTQIYRTTEVFTETTVPDALLKAHQIKAGSRGVLRVLAGRIWLVYEDRDERILLSPEHPGLIEPEAPHHVELDGPVQFQIDFLYDRPEGKA
ncbi:MAG: DUF1971 domain-containing protein [Paracoccus sp. (in: a-proteobacteria)]|uniref:DUF1971 domain-containing protein n=1 Tax=Paracoccus sp. TaxID=267 RepID=UPI0026E05B81|nr:DUF1971 domain-containing protein [Paracoccus sp. (in: a-proteobacteria)]MDO5622415.1 DUF1971 domain-containing protein [Paracoccus sp. (in: a-proteobacteria)]